MRTSASVDDVGDDGQPSKETDVRVGRRVRALRLERGLSITQTAHKAGISVGTLSQIERGITSLRVRTLWPLAAALEAEPGKLIDDENDTASDLYVVRRPNRRTIPVHSEGITKEVLSPPGATLTGLFVVIEAGAGTGGVPYRHAGHEFALVLAGELEITIDNVVYRLKVGDSFAFKSALPHAFRNPGSSICEVLWVNTAKPSEVKDGA
jgi:transcriptional regulator with XRE-family HTH domain